MCTTGSCAACLFQVQLDYARHCDHTATVQGERRIRGSGIYAQASLVNHECLPNVGRVDDFDADSENRTHIALRTLHALPAGEQIFASYTPLHWELSVRQQQCQEVFGFQCCCPRCLCERDLDDETHSNSDHGDLQQSSDVEPADPGYVQIFLLKYVCSQASCFGTLVPEEGSVDKVAQCNICGYRRTEADFLQSLEVELGGQDDL
jgi:SET domain